MTDALDTPIWSALTTRQHTVALGDGLARRFDPAYGPFAATKVDAPASFDALAALLSGQDVAAMPGEGMALSRRVAALSGLLVYLVEETRARPQTSAERGGGRSTHAGPPPYPCNARRHGGRPMPCTRPRPHLLPRDDRVAQTGHG